MTQFLVDFKLKRRPLDDEIAYIRQEMRNKPYNYSTFYFFKNQFEAIKDRLIKEYKSTTGESYRTTFKNIVMGWTVDIQKFTAFVKRLNLINTEIEKCRTEMNRFL